MPQAKQTGSGRYRLVIARALLLVALSASIPDMARAQLLRQGDYGAGVTVAIYQYDDLRSKPFPLVSTLSVAASTAEEEIEQITRAFGAEELRICHTRSIGLREGESFSDTQPMNGQPMVWTLTPRLVTRGDMTFDLSVSYAGKVLLEVKSVTVNTRETVVLRGSQGNFATGEFKGPNGTEKSPATRALLVTVTPVIQNTTALKNKASDISRPTDQFGSKVVLDRSDIFVMPSLTARVPLNFAPGSQVRGSITLEGIVTPEGRVTNVRVLDTPDPALNPKAIDAFRQYRFTPAQLNGRPTYATYRETIILGKSLL